MFCVCVCVRVCVTLTHGPGLSIVLSVDNSDCPSSKGGLSGGAIAGIAIGATLGAILLIGLVVVMVLRIWFPTVAEKCVLTFTRVM